MAAQLQEMISVLEQRLLEIKQGEEAQRRYAQRLEVMQTIDRAILAARSLEAIARAAVSHIRYLVPCQRASVVTFDFEANEATVLAVNVRGETKMGWGVRSPLEAFRDTEDLRQGMVRVVEDVLALPQPSAVSQALLEEGIRSQINVPLLVQGELIGTLNLGADRPGAFEAEHIEIACDVANVLAIAIQQANLVDQVRRHAEELEQEVAARMRELAARNRELLTLQTISEISLGAESLHAAYQVIVEEISVGTGFPMVAIEHYDEARQMMVFRGVKGIPMPPHESKFEVPVEETLSGVVARTGQPVIETHAWERSEYANETLRKLGVSTFICIPMAVGGRVIGTLSLGHPETIQLDDRLPRFAASLANRVASLTVRKEVEEQLRLQVTALEAAANGIVITDRQGIIRWVNPAFTTMTGYTSEDALGKSVRLVRSGRHNRSFYQQLWDTILSGQVWHGELINRRKDESLYVEEQTITPVQDRHGEISHFIAIKQDITERKRAEEILRKLAQLEERQRIAAEIHDGLGQTLSYLGLKVDQVAELAAAGRQEAAVEELQRVRATIGQASQEIRRSIASLQETPKPPQALSDRLAEMMAEHVIGEEPPAELIIESQADLFLPRAEAEQVVSVVREALLNAARHAQAEHIIVRLERQGVEAVVSVEDDGQGFDPQTPPADGQSHFGLNIMRARAVRLGGELSIHSAPERGTRVVLCWPVERTLERGE